MFTFLYLQRRRVFFVWLALILPTVTCACIRTLPPDVTTSRVILWFGYFFTYKFFMALGVMLAIWLLPLLRGLIDGLIAGALLLSAMTVGAQALGLSKPLATVIILPAIFLFAVTGFGAKFAGRWSWFSYRGKATMTFRQTPEELWPRLAPNSTSETLYASANLLGIERNPEDPSQMTARYAAAKGTVLTVKLSNIREDYPSSFAFDYEGDMKLLDGALTRGSQSTTLQKSGSDSSVVSMWMKTAPLPFLLVWTLWLDDLAGDTLQSIREIILVLPVRSSTGRANRQLMRSYQAIHTT